MFQKLGSLNNEPALPSTSYLPATPSVVPASSYIPSSETPAGQPPPGGVLLGPVPPCIQGCQDICAMSSLNHCWS